MSGTSSTNKFVKNKNKGFSKNNKHSKHHDVSVLFNKKYHFRKSLTWKLPNYTANTIRGNTKFDYEELSSLKQNLNAVKSKLNDFPIEEWSIHTRKRNPAGEIQWKLRTDYNTEFVTQAWCKMFECLNSYDLVGHSSEKSTFSSLHLCEAPGAFIAALNHYLKTKYKDIELKWIATTLNPYYEGNQVSTMILDDRFMFHTLQNWYFGSDFTGNIMDKNNIQSLKLKCEEIQPIMLITADGSIDCVQTPEEQENKVAYLHIYEVLSALSILHSGGSFLLKMFTFFECSSVNILYLLNVAFENVNIFKPVTSKSGNSEVYVICLNYKPNDNIRNYINLLLDQLDAYNSSIESIFRKEDIPDDFITQTVDCARYFMNIQCKVIEDNILKYFKPIPFHITKNLKASVTQFFLTSYNVRSIEETSKIVSGYDYYSSQNLNPRLHTGSYNERVKPLDSSDQINLLWNRCYMFEQYHWPLQECMKILRKNDFVEYLDLSLIYGKAVNILCSSKFILAPILDLYKQAKKLCSSYVMHNSHAEAWFHIHNDNKLKNEKFVCIINEKYVGEDICEPFCSYDKYEKHLFKKFLDLKINEGEHIAIWNFPTLTLFSVGVLYILYKYYFEQVAFLKFNCILFFKHKKCVRPYLQELFHKMDYSSSHDSSILSVVPISDICGGEFYDNVLMFNNANFMYESYLLLCAMN